MRTSLFLFLIFVLNCTVHAQFKTTNLVNTWTGNFEQINYSGVADIAVIGDTAIIGGEFGVVNNGYIGHQFFPVSIDSLKNQSHKYPDVNFSEFSLMRLYSYENKGKIVFGRGFIQGHFVSSVALLDSNYHVVKTDFNHNFTGNYVSMVQQYNDTILMGHGYAIDYKSHYASNLIRNKDLTYVHELRPDNYKIECVQSDGSGGYFTGGSFGAVDRQRRTSLAHFNSLGEVTNWTAETNGTVYAMQRFGDTLFIGGSFSLVNGIARNNLAAIDIPTGNVLPWTCDAEDSVFTLLIHGTILHIGGSFTTMKGVAREGYARVSIASGAVAYSNTPGGTVLSMAISNNRMYLGGYFKNVNLSITTGLLICALSDGSMQNNWMQMDAPVTCFAVKGDTVFAGGKFTRYGYPTTKSLLAFRSNQINPCWNPSNTITTFNGPISGLAIVDNDLLVVGGLTVYHNSILYHNSVVIDANSLQLKGKGIEESCTRLLTMDSKFVILNNLGGWNSYYNQVSYNKFWMYDVKNDTVLSTNDVILQSGKLSFDLRGENVILSGIFSRVDSQAVNRNMLEFDRHTKSFTSNYCRLNTSDDVRYIGFFDSTWLMLNYSSSGTYMTIFRVKYGDTSYSSMKNLNWVTKFRDIELHDTFLYVFGDFGIFPPDTSARIVSRIGVRSLTVDNIGWKIYHTTTTNSIKLAYRSHYFKDSILYLAGAFSSVLDTNCYGFAAINLNTKKLLPSEFGVYPGRYIQYFTRVGDEFFAQGFAKSIVTKNLCGVTMDGDFVDLGIQLNGKIVALHSYGDTLIIAGAFTNVNNTGINYLLKYNVKTHTIDTNWRIQPNYEVQSMYATENSLFIAGYFTKVGNIQVDHLAGINKRTGAYFYKSQDLYDPLATLFASLGEDSLYYLRNNSTVQVVDLKTGNNVRSIRVKKGSYGHSFACIDSVLHFVGFDSVAHLKTFGGIHTNYQLKKDTIFFAPYTANGITGNYRNMSFYHSPNQLIVAGSVSSIGKRPTGGIFELDKTTGLFTGRNGFTYNDDVPVEQTEGYYYFTKALSVRDSCFASIAAPGYGATFAVPLPRSIHISASLLTPDPCKGQTINMATYGSEILPKQTIWHLELYRNADLANKELTLFDTAGGSQPVLHFEFSDSLYGSYFVKLVCAGINIDILMLSANEVTIYDSPKALPLLVQSSTCLSGNYFKFSDSLVSQQVSVRKWLFTGLPDAFTLSPQVTFADTGKKEITLYLENNQGCWDDTTLFVHVYQDAEAHMIVTNEACVQDTVLAIDSSFTAGGSLRWEVASNTYLNKDTLEMVIDSAGSYLILLIAETPNGCIDSISETLSIWPKPEKILTINDTVQCFSVQSFDFTFVANRGPNTQYSWLVLNDSQYVQDITAYQFSDTGTHSIHLLLESPHGCLDSLEENAYVKPDPAAIILINDSVQCANNNLFGFAATGSLATFNYKWLINDSLSSSVAYFSTNFSQAGNYTSKLIIETTWGCVDSAEKPFYVLPAPNIPSLVYRGDTILTDSGFHTYHWYRNDTLQNTYQSFYVDHPQSGKYKVTVFNADSCEETSSEYTHLATDYNLIENGAVRIYPNPTKGFVQIERVNGNYTECRVIIRDIQGRNIHEQKSKETHFILDLTPIIPGVYFLTYSDGATEGTIKLMVQ